MPSLCVFVMPCVPRTFHSFVPQSLHSLHNLCLHGIRPAGNVLRGESGGRPMPIVRARLVPRQLPPQPPYAGSGSHGLTVHCWTEKFISSPSAYRRLSAPCRKRNQIRVSSWACIIFFKAKCRANPAHIQSTCP